MSPGPPVRFEAPLELLPWGRNVYTVIKVPHELAVWAGRDSTRRVEGSLDGVPVNVGLNRADVIPESFIYVGSGLRQRLEGSAGDLVQCELSPADPDLVPVPDDVVTALEHSGQQDAFERLPASHRRRLLAPIESAKRPVTRERRVAALLASLLPN